MKIDFNPHAAAQAQNARGSQTQTTPPAPEGSDEGVTITLSQTAKQLLKGDTDYSGKSPAHMARAALAKGDVTFAEGQDASTMPFGQLVKTFAPGYKEPEVVEEPAPTDGGDVGDVGDVTEPSGETGGTGTTEGGDTTVTDGSGDAGDTGTTEGDDTTVVAAPRDGEDPGIGDTDPTIVIEQPDITEILEDSAPAEGETTEPDAGQAGSGDAVASDGSGSGDTGTTEGAPAVVVDGGGLTNDLIDLLDENGEEVV